MKDRLISSLRFIGMTDQFDVYLDFSPDLRFFLKGCAEKLTGFVSDTMERCGYSEL